MRLRAATLALLLAAPCAAQDPPYETQVGDAKLQTSMPPGEVVANALLLPLALAFALPHYGFERHPYEGAGYGRGERGWAASLRLAGQTLPEGRGGGHAALQVRGANRLGWEVSWDGYAVGAIGSSRRTDLYSAHIDANYLQSGRAFFDLSLGGAIVHNERSRSGPSAAAALELFPRRPWTASARYQAALLERQAWHDLSARLGAALGPAGVWIGYRAFLGPLGDTHGPEAGLTVWF